MLRNVPVAVVDNSHTAQSRQLVRALDATPNLRVAYKSSSLEEAKRLFHERKINGIIVIPSDYEKKIMRNERVNISIYADASYFLMYRQVFFDVMGSVLYSNSQIEWVRFVAKGAQPGQAAALSNPVQTTIENMYNPYGGYATFIMPAILIVIIQQTLLIGIGMVGGTWRERGLYKTLIPWGEKRLSVIPIVLGKSTAYLSIYCATLLYVMGFHYKVFGYPSNGAAGDVVLFLIPVSGNRALVPVQAARKFPVVAALHIHTVSDAQRRVDSAGVDAAMAFPTRQDHTEQQRRRRIHPYSDDGRDAERSKRSVLDLVDSVGTLLHTGLPGHARRTAPGRKGKIGTNEIIRTEKDQPNKQ